MIGLEMDGGGYWNSLAQKVLDWMETEKLNEGGSGGRSRRKHYNITRRRLAPILQRRKEGEVMRAWWVERRKGTS